MHFCTPDSTLEADGLMETPILTVASETRSSMAPHYAKSACFGRSGLTAMTWSSIMLAGVEL